MAEPVPIWIEHAPDSLASGHPAVADLAQRFLSEVSASGIAIALESDGRMVCTASAGRTAPPVGAIVDVNSGITGRCLRESRPLHCYDTDLDPRVEKDACRRLGIRSLAIAPIVSDSKAIGFVEVLSERPGAFDPAQMARLRTLTDEILELVTRGHTEDIESTRESSISVLPEMPSGDAAAHLESEKAEAGESPAPRRNEASSPASTLVNRRARSRGIARTIAWLALVLVGSVAAVSLPRFVHHRSDSRIGEPETATTLSAESSVPGQKLSIRPAGAVEIQPPASSSFQEVGRRARAGDSEAQYQLASLYASGDGVPKDAVKAAVWYIVAANSGSQSGKDAAVQITHELKPFEIAQVRFNVGKMFAEGIGMPKDAVSAYLWFALAEAAGDVRAKSEEGKLAESMTVAEINEAQNRASTWLSGRKRQTAELHPAK